MMAEPLWSLRPPRGQAVGLDRRHACACVAQPGGQTVALLDLPGRASRDLAFTTPRAGVPGQRTSGSSYCSTVCRDSVLALAALHPSPLASSDFISTRALLTDRLLDLWRPGQGPGPGARPTGCPGRQ